MNSEFTLPLAPIAPKADDHLREFAGMYQAGFEAGYEKGRETGYEQGFAAGIAAGQESPANRVEKMQAVLGKPALRTGPRHMLLGMPCKRCRVYLLTEETQCPCCKQPVQEC